MSDVTQILSRIESGDPKAAEQLFPLVYGELRRMARARMANERGEHTLQATALVHEAYLRLVAGTRHTDSHLPGAGSADPRWNGRGHFFAAAAEAMRRILVDHARAKNAIKRGGKLERVELDDFRPTAASGDKFDELLEIDAALERFAHEDAGRAELVKLIYFAGLSISEAAAVQGISRSTAHRHWTYARAWLRDAINGTKNND
jgi:RNA polymerase sigma factor (TIGR02999 family)